MSLLCSSQFAQLIVPYVEGEPFAQNWHPYSAHRGGKSIKTVQEAAVVKYNGRFLHEFGEKKKHLVGKQR